MSLNYHLEPLINNIIPYKKIQKFTILFILVFYISLMNIFFTIPLTTFNRYPQCFFICSSFITNYLFDGYLLVSRASLSETQFYHFFSKFLEIHITLEKRKKWVTIMKLRKSIIRSKISTKSAKNTKMTSNPHRKKMIKVRF